MPLKDDLLQLQAKKGDEWITIDDLPKELKYKPEVFGDVMEIHINKITAILYDYNISERTEIVNETTGRKAVVRFRISRKKK